MNNENIAQILKIGCNGAVVKLPQRRFPGIVIQGDSLSNMVSELINLREEIASGKVTEETFIGIDDVIQQLKGRMEFYEETLKINKIELPYVNNLPK